MMEVRERFLKHVNKTESCWLWTGYIRPIGYASFRIGAKKLEAHRVAYQLFIGDIPIGTEIDHLCRVRNCVNPTHLEATTHKVNMERAEFKSKIFHKDKDHEYTPIPNGKGATCGVCRKRRDRYRYDRSRPLI